MGGGALMQLVANGSQDIYLTGNPEMTYFRAVYRRHTNFAKESILQSTVGTLHQGSKFSVIIGRHGDLLTDVHVVIKRKTFEVSKTVLGSIAGITWGDCSGNFYYPSAGYNFLEYVEVEIGGQIIDKHYGDWLNIWTDLTEPNDKKMLLNQMVYGKTRLIPREADIFKDGDIYLPLQFWFCNNPGLALPLIALQYHEVKLNFSLTPSCFSGGTSAWVDVSGSGSVSDSSGTVTTLGDASGNSHALEGKVGVEIPAEPNIIDELSVYADYIFLDTEERRKFAKVKHEYLFEQIQTQGPTSLSTTIDREAVDIRFNHPIKEMIWTLDDAAPSVCAPVCESKKYEIIKAGVIQLNGKDRFQKRNGSYFTVAQRYQHHSGAPLKYLFETLYSGDLRAFKKNWSEFTGSGIPSEAIHLYSFALHPEKNIPSGSCNFSRLDNVVLELEFFTGQGTNPCLGSSRPCNYPEPSKRTLWVYGINYNVLRIMGGMGGLVYCN